MPKRILVVDDNPGILDALNEILSFSGYEVATLAEGDRVFDLIREFHPDLILLDIMLDNLDGRDICHEIKRNVNTRHIPVILISASHSVQDLLQSPDAPNDFVAKPFDMHYLLSKIDHQLDSAA